MTPAALTRIADATDDLAEFVLVQPFTHDRGTPSGPCLCRQCASERGVVKALVTLQTAAYLARECGQEPSGWRGPVVPPNRVIREGDLPRRTGPPPPPTTQDPGRPIREGGPRAPWGPLGISVTAAGLVTLLGVLARACQ